MGCHEKFCYIRTCDVQKHYYGVVIRKPDCEKHQFGFKAHHSTGLCTQVFKQTVDYYVNRGSHVFAYFIDYTKAFDCVNYWKLFSKLLHDNTHTHTHTRLTALFPGLPR